MDIATKLELVATSILAASLVATPVLAQPGEGRQEQQAREQRATHDQVHILAHDAVVGASVTNGRQGDAAETLGRISDLVLDGRNGHVRYAVLASGGTLGVGKRQTSISWDALSWDAKHSRFALSMTAEALEKLPEFDPDSLHRLGRAAADASSGTGAGRSQAGTNGGEVNSGTERDMRASLMLASKVGDCTVVAGNDEVGAADTLFIEPASGCAAFLTVASGGVAGIGETTYVVPWDALRLVKPIGKQEMQIQLDKAREALDAAPKLSDEGAGVTKPEFRAKVYEFYGVESPAFEPKTSKGRDDRIRRDQDGRR